MQMPNIKEFLAEHQKFFEKQESKYNILLGLALRLRKKKRIRGFQLFSFGRPGAAALQMENRNLVLGDLSPEDCAKLASHYSDLPYPGFIGADSVCDWFLTAAGPGHFQPPLHQGIFQLDGPPRKPPVAGELVRATDTYLLVKWMTAFDAEIGETTRQRDDLRQRAESSPFYFWQVDGEPVAMAGIVREGVKGATIGAVYTLPDHRGHRYGEAAVAGVAEEILKRGKEFSSLYADEANPASNKIYARIGYRFLCHTKVFRRRLLAGG